MEVVGFFTEKVDVESPEVTSKSDVTLQIENSSGRQQTILLCYSDDAIIKAEVIWTFIGFKVHSK